jgi:hypothetical protein
MRTRGPIPNESFYKHKNIKSDNYQEPQYLRKRIVYGVWTVWVASRLKP